MDNQIIVIGAGISGITTALTLQLLGHKTEIYTDQTVNQVDDKNKHPEFASYFPSASVIPHSVYSDQLKDLFLLSQSTFYELRKQVFPGVTIHKHFEIFEPEPKQPAYCNWMLNLRDIDELDPDTIPRRPDAKQLHGWMFDCLFADWSLYFPALVKLYEKVGGKITQQKLEPGDINNLPAETIINCSGTGAPYLFDDPLDDHLIQRGHLLHNPDAPVITNSDNEIISYNYTPPASVYADSDGNPCDVYYYPRKDGWILGGSRQSGTLNEDNRDQTQDLEKSYEIDGISLPSQIVDLNNEILEHTFNCSLDHPSELVPSFGYRYIRSKNNGLRLESESINNKTIFHNYGHGGAGVTLSWGCALKIAENIVSQEADLLHNTILGKISNTELVPAT